MTPMYACIIQPFLSSVLLSPHPLTPITVSAGCFCSDHLWHRGSQHSSKVCCECLHCLDCCTLQLLAFLTDSLERALRGDESGMSRTNAYSDVGSACGLEADCNGLCR